ncbi:ComF family protein [Candidatus Parcubacteria bacterium]|nr:MAG: ComF family protein [Candidatus Parcubacteria bacterium]
MSLLSNYISNLADYIFPRFCVSCGKEGGLLCSVCGIDWRANNLFAKNNGKHFFSFNYANPIARDLIKAWKYDFDQSAWQILQEKLTLNLFCLADYIKVMQIKALLPIRLHPRRLRERGFDQAVEIANFLANCLHIPVLPILKRIRYTKQQVKVMDTKTRVAAMRDNPFIIEADVPANVMLVDDVWTTGATAKAAARAVKRAGAKEVFFYTLAKG